MKHIGTDKENQGDDFVEGEELLTEREEEDEDASDA